MELFRVHCWLPLALVISCAFSPVIARPGRSVEPKDDRFKICSADISGSRAVTREAKAAACSALLEQRDLNAYSTALIYMHRANAYNVGDPRKLSDLLSSVKVDPTFSYGWAKLCALYNWGNPDKTNALRACNVAVDQNPEDPGVWVHLGDVYADSKDYQKAIGMYDRSIKLHSKWMHPWINRGWAYLQLGDTQRAVRDFDRAIQIAPDYAMGYLNRGTVELKLGQPDRAEVFFDKGIAIDPACAACFYGRGLAKATVGKDGQGDMAAALKLDPKAADGFASLNLLPPNR